MRAVLVADDSKLMRQMVTEAVADIEGHKIVATATDGDEFVEAYRDHSPDVVIIDVEMPTLNGPEAASKIGLRGEQHLVFLSGDSHEPRGDEHVLKKPFDDSDLDELLTEIKSGDSGVTPASDETRHQDVRRGS